MCVGGGLREGADSLAELLICCPMIFAMPHAKCQNCDSAVLVWRLWCLPTGMRENTQNELARTRARQ